MPNLHDLLAKALQENAIVCTDIIQQKLIHYLELLQTWNRVFNLTTITEPKEMVYLHLIDSLAVAPHLQGKRCLDVGSGAGLPGIPLALMHPDQAWTLLDKNNKKTRFLTQAVAELGMTNVTVVHARSEDFHPAGCFDSILSRAFGTISLFVETTEHLLCPHGRWIAMKGKYPQEELDDLPRRFMAQQMTRLNLKGIDIERHVVCLCKKSGEE